MVRQLILFLIFIASVTQAFATDPIGFTDWKNQQITKSQSQLDQARQQALKSPGEVTISQAKIMQLQYEQAKELTVSDYFAGYVLGFSDDKANMIKIVQKLSADENAQLLLSFAKNLSHQKEVKSERSASRSIFD